MYGEKLLQAVWGQCVRRATALVSRPGRTVDVMGYGAFPAKEEMKRCERIVGHDGLRTAPEPMGYSRYIGAPVCHAMKR